MECFDWSHHVEMLAPHVKVSLLEMCAMIADCMRHTEVLGAIELRHLNSGILMEAQQI